MPLRVFVAGSTGVIGKALLPRLRQRGHHVTALARGADRAELVPDGADEVVVADVMDPRALREVVTRSAPDVVVHQATGFGDADLDSALRRTTRLRDRGTRNLVSAAVSAGARRVIAQSDATAYAPYGHDVLDEEAPLWTEAPGRWGECVRSVEALEEAVLTCPDIEGFALRYGALYGPGTGFAPSGTVHRQVVGSELPVVRDGGGVTSFTHVDDAAQAVVEVLSAGDPGAYNVVDNEPTESGEWLPVYARMAGGPDPLALTLEQARNQLDWLTVHQLTEQRGATNFRLRESVGWRPSWPSWREGFAALLGVWAG